METSDFSSKSLLKKHAAIDPGKAKRVTFNNTVKLFIDDCNQKTKSNSVRDPRMDWIEISIVDKSTESSTVEQSCDDCKVTDFLVHKVIYDNYILPENDEDLDIHSEVDEESPVLYESGLDEDGLEFVVHKVTDHEDDLIEKDTDFAEDGVEVKESCDISNLDESAVVTKLSKLSVENILEHDKIIAFIDQRSLGLSSLNKTSVTATNDASNSGYLINNYSPLNSSVKNADDLFLSPPLQELSLEKIVKAHTDNILCELDISPLNSIQETDSDSDASSEGTMIMMTSEECQKNEQHIRESLLQYQSLKEKSARLNVQSKDSEGDTFGIPVKSDADNNILSTKVPENATLDSTSNVGNVEPFSTDFISPELSANVSFTEDGSSNDSSNEPQLLKKRIHSSSLPDTDVLHANRNVLQSKHLAALKRTSSESGAHSQEKSLTSIEIPSDVREWKILLSSLEKNAETSPTLVKDPLKTSCFVNGNGNRYSISELSVEADCAVTSTPNPRSDELENFVQESTERVERIRKRYYVDKRQLSRFGASKHSPVRGIRPRFGSTAEILQLMQKKNNPPFIAYSGTKTHMSWPCEETSSSPELDMNMLVKNPPCYYVSQSLTSEYSSHSSIDSYCEEQLNSSCDHCSISSCPPIIMHERGVPEGASPPRPRTEINVDIPSSNDSSDSFVYFSMKV